MDIVFFLDFWEDLHSLRRFFFFFLYACQYVISMLLLMFTAINVQLVCGWFYDVQTPDM